MKYGLIGNKLGHSFSKEIHERIAHYTYDLIPLNQDEFINFMKNKDFKAINVTIPYKKDVIPYLDEIDEQAKTIGAVNTIVNKDGKLIGHNTDYAGFAYMVHHHNISMKDKKVLIIGNGGAAQAVKAVVKNQQAKEMIIVGRTVKDNVISYEECYRKHTDSQIIINTSPVGMFPNLYETPICLDKFHQCEAVLDVIYNPITTKLTLDAQDLNIPYVNGLEMLVAQAKYAVEYFLDSNIKDSIIDKIYKDILCKESNLVLLGMPSAGKTTIGKCLAAKMKKSFIDLDDVIVKKAGMRIPEIFHLFGEEGFRHLETLVAKKISKEHNAVISTGGGIVLKKENIDALRLNGITFFIDRNLDDLIYKDSNRPLLNGKDSVEKLYTQRYPLYQKYADQIIKNDGSLEQCVENIALAYEKKIYNI